MQSKISRRAIVKGGLIAGAFIPAIGLMANSAAAAGLPPLDPKDPTAQALGFVADATQPPAVQPPQYPELLAVWRNAGGRSNRRRPHRRHSIAKPQVPVENRH